MSKTFTSRPAVTRGRGRGTQTNQGARPNVATTGAVTGFGRATGVARGTGTTRSSGYGTGAVARSRNTQMAEEEDVPEGQQGANTGQEQRMTYQSGFTMITPNEKKRQQIAQVAQRETQAYEQHRQQNKPKSLNIVGTVGGGELTQAQARQKIAQSSPNKTQKLLQQQERKSWLKQKEDVEIQEKRAVQRAKAEQNERRKKDADAQDAAKWDRQMEVTNDAFLRRLENKTGSNGGTAPRAPVAYTASSSSSQGATSLPVAMTHERSRSDDIPDQSNVSGNDLDSEQMRRLNAISVMFPQYSKDELRVILEQVDFSLDAAVSLLQD